MTHIHPSTVSVLLSSEIALKSGRSIIRCDHPQFLGYVMPQSLQTLTVTPVIGEPTQVNLESDSKQSRKTAPKMISHH